MLDAVCSSVNMSNAGAGSHPDLAQVGEVDTQRPCLFCCYSHQRYKSQDCGENNLLCHTTLGHRGRKRPDIIITSIRASPALHNDNTAGHGQLAFMEFISFKISLPKLPLFP